MGWNNKRSLSEIRDNSGRKRWVVVIAEGAVVSVVSRPNIFWRAMQRLFFGFKYKELKNVSSSL